MHLYFKWSVRVFVYFFILQPQGFRDAAVTASSSQTEGSSNLRKRSREPEEGC